MILPAAVPARRLLPFAVAAAVLLFHGPAPAAEVRIAAGDAAGVYRAIGEAICAGVRADQPAIGCTVIETDGSVDNLRRLKAGTVDVALAQADIQFLAANGLPPFDGADALPALQSIAALHEEMLTIVVKADATARTLADLVGQRLNVASSGTKRTFNLVLGTLGWLSDSVTMTELSPADQPEALCAGRIDAAVFVVGHPNPSLQEAAAACQVRVLPVAESEVMVLTLGFPFFVAAEVPTALYGLDQAPVPTVGVPATLVTLPGTPDPLIAAVAGAVYSNTDRLRASHPALARIAPDRMSWAGLFAPLHPLAEAAADAAEK